MIRQFLRAVSFLTRIPAAAGECSLQHLGQSARWFPLVGLALGSVFAGVAWLLQRALPASVIAVLVILLDAVLTGALHLDGLADMADGFGGWRTRDEVLRIMRDHAIGSYGATALVLVLLLKFVCLTQLVEHRCLWVLFVAPTFSRWAIVSMTQIAPYARPTMSDIGTGALSAYIRKTELVISTLTCIALPFFFGAIRTLVCWAVVAATTLVVAAYCRHRIGGITGDTLGANVVVAEAFQLVAAVMLCR